MGKAIRNFKTATKDTEKEKLEEKEEEQDKHSA
jgi:Sec-independent protein translocase protein TatA